MIAKICCCNCSVRGAFATCIIGHPLESLSPEFSDLLVQRERRVKMLLFLLDHLFAFFAFFAVSRAHQIPLTAPHASPLTPGFDELVADTLAHWHTPGLSIAVVDGDKTFSKVYSQTTFSIGRLNSIGIRHCVLPQREGHTFNSFLHGLHYQVLHRSSRLPPHR